MVFLPGKLLLINYPTRSMPVHVNDSMKNTGVNEYILILFPGFADIVHLEACGLLSLAIVLLEIKPNRKHVRHFIPLSALINAK